MFVGHDLTEHQKRPRKAAVVNLHGPLGGVVRLSADDLRRGRAIMRRRS
jgi:hypothetical protein